MKKRKIDSLQGIGTLELWTKILRTKEKKQELVPEVWTTYRWITEYLTRTTAEWEDMKNKRIAEESTRMETWENKTTAQKIAICIEEQEQISMEKNRILTSIQENLLSDGRTTINMATKDDGGRIPETLPENNSEGKIQRTIPKTSTTKAA